MWSRQLGTGLGLATKVLQRKLLGDVEVVREGEWATYLHYQGSSLVAADSGLSTGRYLVWKHPYFRRGIEALQGRVTCPRSYSWVRLSRDPLLCPKKLPALWVHQVGLGRPNTHPEGDLAHGEDLG